MDTCRAYTLTLCMGVAITKRKLKGNREMHYGVQEHVSIVCDNIASGTILLKYSSGKFRIL